MFHTKISLRSCLLLSALVLLPVAPALAQRGGGFRDAQPTRANAQFLKAFHDSIIEPSQCTVRVLCDDKEAALGTIVGSEGWILTKYSLLSGAMACKLKSGSKLDAKIVGVHEAYDIALLKIEATGLPAVTFIDSKVAPVGSWLVSVGLGEEPVAVGVMSVARRTPPPVRNRGPGRPGSASPPDYLGLNVVSDGIAVRVVRIASLSAAAKAGLQIDDQILSIQGAEITDQNSLRALLAKLKVGDSIAIKLVRDGKDLELKAKLQLAIAPNSLGVNVTSNGTAAKVVEVARRSAAERAGIKTDDLIVSIEGSAVSDQKSLLSILGKKKPGDTVKIKLMREGKEQELQARLQQRGPQQRQDQNQMGSELSVKRTGFPTYFQSDTILKPKDCGGPVCDLEGRVIGINIARAGRVESYAIPSTSLTALLPELKSGKLAPELLALRKQISELKASILKATEGRSATDKKVEDAQAAAKQPANDMAEIDKKLKSAEEALEKAEKKLKGKKSPDLVH